MQEIHLYSFETGHSPRVFHASWKLERQHLSLQRSTRNWAPDVPQTDSYAGVVTGQMIETPSVDDWCCWGALLACINSCQTFFCLHIQCHLIHPAPTFWVSQFKRRVLNPSPRFSAESENMNECIVVNTSPVRPVIEHNLTVGCRIHSWMVAPLHWSRYLYVGGMMMIAC